MSRSARLLWCSLMVVSGGCGGLVSNRYAGQTLVTLQGKLLASATSTPDATPVGLTVFWYGATSPGAAAAPTTQSDPTPPLSCPAPHLENQSNSFSWATFVSQSVIYEPQFPIDFTIPVTQVPPASAQLDLAPLGGTGKLATGFVVAYRDTNHNGRYDFGTPAQDPEPIISSSRGARVLFLDGHLAGARLDMPGVSSTFDTQGISIVVADDTGAFHTGPASTPIVLTEEASVETAELGCATLQLDLIYDAVPLADATATCLGPRGYLWEVTQRPSVCHHQQHRGVVCLDSSSTPPPTWPCR